MARERIKETTGDRVFNFINYTVATLVLLIIAYPVWVVIISSFSDPNALMSGKVWITPVGFNLDGYAAILRDERIWTGLTNSLIYTVFGTLVNMIVTVLAAYPLSRKDFTLRGPISLIFAFTMWFSGGLIPTFLLVQELGLFNTRLAMILPTAMSVWNMIILRTYFQSNVGGELLEAAKIDGCDDFQYLWKIALPLSKPSLAVICLYYLVANWNTFMNAYLYLTDESLYPIQVVLRDILLLGSSASSSSSAMQEGKAVITNELIKYSVVIAASLPMIIIYPFIQKFFVKGIMVGSVKG